jgi:hypothetical protein
VILEAHLIGYRGGASLKHNDSSVTKQFLACFDIPSEAIDFIIGQCACTKMQNDEKGPSKLVHMEVRR